MRTFIRVSLAILLVSVLAWASNPWEDTPYQKWSQDDVHKVLNDSPWATTIRVQATWKSAQASGGGSGRRGRRGGGGAASNVVIYEVRWVSAATLREGLVRQQILAGKMTQAQADKFVSASLPIYEIVFFGQDMTPFQKLTEDQVAKATSLQLKGSDGTLSPSKVTISRDSQGRVMAVVLAFPKNQNNKPFISGKAKEVDLVCNTDQIKLKFKFDPRKMMTKSGLDL